MKHTQAVTHILRGAYEDANGCLQSALSLNPSDAETLINMVAVSQYLSKPQEVRGEQWGTQGVQGERECV